MMDIDQETALKFSPFCSVLDAGFWHLLSKNKLELYGLDESPKPLHGFYFNGDSAHVPSRLNLDFTAFDSDEKVPPRCHLSPGTLINKNTLDGFKDCNKQEIIDAATAKIWEAIQSGSALATPSVLSPFILLTFADLKHYKYYYWFAFPCMAWEQNIKTIRDAEPIGQKFTDTQILNITTEYDRMESPAYFVIVHKPDDTLLIVDLKTAKNYTNNFKMTFAFADPCTNPSHPGWPIRNYLILIAHQFISTEQSVEILCYRDRTTDGQRSVDHSIVLTLSLSPITQQSDCPKNVGWERNERQKLGPRMVDLSSSLDPVRLSESAVDLNLKLMRWRLIPELDLDLISSQKCLLLGSGTLGCNVARCLLGWGVRTITFVDNGKVSYSNPVRQSLFNFDDCLHGGRSKAEAAAESLARIFPGVISRGVNLSIPMPGHTVSEALIEQAKQDVQLLETLIDSHDVVFLLLDTRESRWLPTLLGAAKGKIVLNAALGFDTFLVLRHGIKQAESAPSSPPVEDLCSPIIHGTQLGCYFCNDVVAPGDSTKDRTLDQQCTVSRPGMSMMVGALVVELFVSILQHPDGAAAYADTSLKDEHLTTDYTCALGLVPHQIRGFLSRFYNILPASRAFKHCTACSRIVMNEYKSNGMDFLLKAFNEPSYLEDLTGLTALHMETLEEEVWGLSEDESIESLDS